MIIPAYHNYSFVVASVLIAVLTAYVAMETSARIPEHRGDRRTMWVFISASCLGGGIWSMHFVAMLGFVIPITIGYNIALTVFSLLLPIGMAAWGFHLAFRTRKLHWRKNLGLGFIYGLAIVGMHYTGMAAMDMEASIDWNVIYVAASILVAIVASTAAIKASFARMSFLPTLVGSMLMGFAISGMHYTAMCAVTVIGEPVIGQEPSFAFSLSREELGLGVTAMAFIILMTGLITAAYDRHRFR